MALNSLLALRHTLIADAGINSYCQSVYGKLPTHNKRYTPSQNAADFPCFSYTPISTRGDGTINALERVSVVIGVNDPAVGTDIMAGFTRCGELAELVLAAIAHGYLGDSVTYMNKFDLISDFGERHPIYETELQLNFIYRR